MALGLLAIVGSPSVGKSTIFNRIIGEKKSIIETERGVTRDRIYGKAEWLTREFNVVDTGGIEVENRPFQEQIRAQVEIAIDEADVILFVVDGQIGMNEDDQMVANMLYRTKKPIILAVNKIDENHLKNNIYEFYSLGLGDPIPTSGAHGVGIGDILDKVIEYLPKNNDSKEDSAIKFSIIGRPNVGKSSLCNAILNEERVIVSNIEGTTRDAIDSYFENKHGKYNFIDTAGIRRKSKVNENIEKYSVMRSLLAVERADVCLILIDANEGVTDQDAKIAGEAHEAGKGIIIVVNKWDEVEKDNQTMENYKKDVYNKLSYLSYAPIMFISAKTGQRVNKLYEMINMVASQNALRVSTSVLNDVLSEAVTIVQPPTDKGKRLKIFYMTQATTKPPTFVVFVNDKELFHFSYERYLMNQIRKEFGLTGTPIRMIVREKGDKE